ncbi:hypothetical protein KAR91_50525 [Candidatus Pacearchaeota archaeon]|nr:hypothetical protein [Candidatus Pacearchaeota archaeon]
MPIGLDEFNKGVRPMEKDSWEHKVFSFLKEKKSTSKPAYTISEIIESIGYSYKDNYEECNMIVSTLPSLVSEGLVVAKGIKKEGTIEHTTYYMAK